MNPQHQQKRKSVKAAASNSISPSSSRFQLLPQTAHVCFHSRKRVHTRLRQQDRTQRHTRRNRGVSDGGAITTLGAVTRFGNPAWPGVRTANFAAFGSWPEVLRRTQRACGTAMRLCASLSRGVAAPLGCVIFSLLSKLRLLHPALSAFRCARRGVVSLPSACFACC